MNDRRSFGLTATGVAIYNAFDASDRPTSSRTRWDASGASRSPGR